mmetsp:Transcript_25692/g.50612  ORF Transcript_25692/g.50612 Transcript_25692/m.50612 type:complete len:87 (+) Transcript_25692:1082-1342(+)
MQPEQQRNKRFLDRSGLGNAEAGVHIVDWLPCLASVPRLVTGLSGLHEVERLSRSWTKLSLPAMHEEDVLNTREAPQFGHSFFKFP